MIRRHVYDRLEVTGELTRVFDAGGEDALGRAVRHLDEVREGRLVWLMAGPKVKVGRSRLRTHPWPAAATYVGSLPIGVGTFCSVNSLRHCD